MSQYRYTTLIAGTMLAFPFMAHAQDAAPPGAPASTTRVGPVDLTYHKGAAFAGNQVRVSGDVRINSQTFAAQAETITLDLLRGSKSGAVGGIGRAAMEPLANHQVSGRFQDIAQGRNYQFQADHAVYVPDNARPGGGRIDLTGHVRLAVNAPIALDGPLVTVTDHAVVLLGQGTQYPQVQTGAGHLTFTPLNGGQ